jgi:transcriptional regulator with XRE-family HTH domain
MPDQPDRRRRATAQVQAGRRRATDVAGRLGRGLREARQSLGLPQREVASRAGVSQPEIAKLELGRGSDTGIDTWAACAAAVGLQLVAFLEQAPGADLPRDLQHLRRQNLVITISAPGGWLPAPEFLLPDDGPRPRSIDVLLTRAARREAAVVEIWDLILDGGAAMRGLEGKVLEVRRRLGPDWHVEGLLIVRGTLRNRRLVAELAALFAARYPASSAAWLRALARLDAPLPHGSGFAWTDVAGTSLRAARLGPRG